MLWPVICLIFKTSLVTTNVLYFFNLILSFSTCNQSFKKSVRRKILGTNVLNIRTAVVYQTGLTVLWPGMIGHCRTMISFLQVAVVP